jgi:hypothetical protein
VGEERESQAGGVRRPALHRAHPLFPCLTPCGWRRYCKASSDPQLTKWWAQYCESQGRFDDAMAVYVLGNDVAAQVLPFCNQLSVWMKN